MSPQLLPRPRGNKSTLIIGFDFGTHSTKVVLRERGKANGRIARFDSLAEGFPRFAAPSVIRQIGDKLLFGTMALNASEGRLYRSLKVDLLSQARGAATTLSNDRLDSEILVAAYLAWAFQQIRDTLLQDEQWTEFINVAAPMDHIEEPQVKLKYLRIVQAAWQLVFESRSNVFKQKVSLSEVVALLHPRLASQVLGPELRRFDVLPETIAPVVSLSLDPYMKPCMYAIIDMGAGTTEMSVFHAGDPGADQKVLCYKDKTMLLGGNDLQIANKQQANVHSIIARIEREYLRIWREAYEIDAASPLAKRRWKDLTLVLSGGGTRHPVLAQRLRRANPVPNWPGYRISFDACRHEPGTLPLPQGMNRDDGSLFAVANGLAIDRKKWPIVFEPHEIEPLTAPDPEPAKPSWANSEYRPRWV